ncbi:MAG: hypothetical protein ABFC89_06455 [Methanospirillum sp.]
METYETIGIAVRQHDAIRLSIKAGELATYYIAAATVGRLFEGATVPLYQLRLAGDFVIPEPVRGCMAEVSATGRSVLVRLGQDCLQIPTRQLQVHYQRGLGETSKIVRRIEGAAAPSAATAAPASPVAVA